MIYIKLIIDFFIVGLLSFGGSYASIPLIKDVASNYEIISEDMLMNFIAISESTPGPIAVNLASFVGTNVGGILGAILVTLAEILPAFLIILIFTIFFKNKLENEKISYGLSIIRPCIVGIIISVGLFMLLSVMTSSENRGYSNIVILVLIIAAIYIHQKVAKKKLSAIKIIILGAIFGIAINYLL